MLKNLTSHLSSWFCIELSRSIQFIYNYKQLKTRSNKTYPDFSLRHNRDALIKPVLWPFCFVTKKSPIEQLSKLLFKNYGEKGHTYLGGRGP